MAATRDDPAADRFPSVLRRLRARFPEATIALDFSTPFECVVATVLSAQSTDVMVNSVTPRLWKKYRRPEDYLAVPEEELQVDIQSTGFFRQKTRSLRGLARKILEDFDGEVPRRIADLTQLPGIARKSANVVQAACFPAEIKKDPDAGIAVDTHVGRVALRLGLTNHDSKEAVKIEDDLKALIPRKDWGSVSYLFIDHGRTICDAKKPLCVECPVEKLCPSSQVAGLPDRYRTHAKPKPPRKQMRRSSG